MSNGESRKEKAIFDVELTELWSVNQAPENREAIFKGLANLGTVEAPAVLKNKLLNPKRLEDKLVSSSRIAWIKPVAVLAPAALVFLIFINAYLFNSNSITKERAASQLGFLDLDDPSDVLPEIFDDDLLMLEDLI